MNPVKWFRRYRRKLLTLKVLTRKRSELLREMMVQTNKVVLNQKIELVKIDFKQLAYDYERFYLLEQQTQRIKNGEDPIIVLLDS